jgi:hypothetical protein
MRRQSDNEDGFKAALTVIQDASCSTGIKLVYLDRAMDPTIYQTPFYHYLDILYSAQDDDDITLIENVLIIYHACHTDDDEQRKRSITETKKTSDRIWSAYKHELNTKNNDITREELKSKYLEDEKKVKPKSAWRSQNPLETPGLMGKIASYLPVKDRISLSLVNSRIRQESFIHRVLNFSGLPDETDEEFMSFNRRPSNGVMALHKNEAITLINLCRNDVTHVNLSGSSVTDKVIAHLMKRLPNIKSLNMANCGGLSEKSVEAIAEYGKQIERLNLSGSLNHYSDTDTVARITKECRSLKYLKLDLSWHSPNLLHVLLQSLANYCPNLELLNVCGNYERQPLDLKLLLSQCKNLRGLALNDNSLESHNNRHFHHCDLPDVNTMEIVRGLEYLRIHGCDPQLLQGVINNNPKLTTLGVTNINIDNILSMPFIESLSELKIDQCHNFTSQKLNQILPRLSQLKRLGLDADLSTNDTLMAIARHCRHLSHLELGGLAYRPAVLGHVVNQCKDLTSLCLMTDGVGLWERSDIDYITALKDGAQLTSLVLADCFVDSYLVQAIMKNCPNLVSLDFIEWTIEKRDFCPYDDMRKCVNSLKKLQTLSIGSNRIQDDCFISGRENINYRYKPASTTGLAHRINLLLKSKNEDPLILHNLRAVYWSLKSEELSFNEKNKISAHWKHLMYLFAHNISWAELLNMDSDTRYYIVGTTGHYKVDRWEGIRRLKQEDFRALYRLFLRHLKFEDVKQLIPQLQIFMNNNLRELYSILDTHPNGLAELKKAGISWGKLLSLQSLELISKIIQYASGLVKLIQKGASWNDIISIESHQFMQDIIINSSNIAKYMSRRLTFYKIKELGQDFLSIITNRTHLQGELKILLSTVNVTTIKQLIACPEEIQDHFIRNQYWLEALLRHGITLEQLASFEQGKQQLINYYPGSVIELNQSGVTLDMLKVLQTDFLRLVLRHRVNVITLLKTKVNWNDIVTLRYKDKLFNETQEITENFLNQFDQRQKAGRFMSNRFLTYKQNQSSNATTLFTNDEENNTSHTQERLQRLFDHLFSTKTCNRNSARSPLEIYKKKSGRSTWSNVCALLDVEEAQIQEALAREKDAFEIWIKFNYLRSQESQASQNNNNP